VGIENKYASLFRLALLAILASCRPQSAEVPTVVPLPTPVLELSHTRSRLRDEAVMVFVPAGHFQMGSSQYPPTHWVELGAFWIDRTEVTNARFAAFLNDRGNLVEDGVPWWEPGAGSRAVVYGHMAETIGQFHPSSGYEDYPMIEVSWYGAAAYCAWAGGRLPTEAEWEYAARGPQSHVYPWGDSFDGARVNYCDASCLEKWRDTHFDDGLAEWGPVGRYPDGASWCGALDLAGNVWEWVSDWWSDDYYAHSPAQNPQGPGAGTIRIARGGSWYEESEQVRAFVRKGLTPSSYRMHWVGFRCVVSAQEELP